MARRGWRAYNRCVKAPLPIRAYRHYSRRTTRWNRSSVKLTLTSCETGKRGEAPLWTLFVNPIRFQTTPSVRISKNTSCPSLPWHGVAGSSLLREKIDQTQHFIGKLGTQKNTSPSPYFTLSFSRTNLATLKVVCGILYTTYRLINHHVLISRSAGLVRQGKDSNLGSE